MQDLTEVVNPHHLEASYVPQQIPHIPIIVPKIDLLVGEEIKRRFDWSVIVTNPDAITKKEDDKKKFLFEKLSKMLEENYQEDELKQKINVADQKDFYQLQENILCNVAMCKTNTDLANFSDQSIVEIMLKYQQL